ETLSTMSARIAHRGPDGEGAWINHTDEVTRAKPQAALAHRRLAILDPDPRSNQPFTDGRHWLVFNGEIYNFPELRAELTAIDSSYEWRTSGDTEVLLRAYAVWGESCFRNLVGMFAVAIWDQSKQQLLLARDRMGQKPLYVAEGAGAMAFASELGALMVVPWVERDLDETELEHFLWLGYTSLDGTIYRNVRKVRPGWCLIWEQPFGERGGFTYEPVVLPKPRAPRGRAAADETRRRVLGAVRQQLVSDVPLGCFLSGGVDSSVIAAAMVKATGDASAVQTFTIGFDDPRYDESEHAAAVAAHLGTRHHRFTVKPDAAADLPRLAEVFGEPFADSSALPTHYLARETRKHVKVALSGDGGDELFGGYDRYRAMQYSEWMRLVPRSIRRVMAKASTNVLAGGQPKSLKQRMQRFLSPLGESAGARYAAYVQLMPPALIAQLLGREPSADPITSWFNALLRQMDTVHAARNVDRVLYLPEDLLTKVDRCSMLHALEVRSPFMDHELVKFAAGLTTHQLLKGGPKRMLREAFAADLPDFVFKRRKMGFAVPIGDWLRGELRSMLRDNLFASDSFARQHFNLPTVQRLVNEHEQSRVDHSQRLYALLMLELWWRIERMGR
ncbi:MAG: asparagine synthase (glutamine-hydrolyzing), partial [Tepidisphaeraceae bacterium]